MSCSFPRSHALGALAIALASCAEPNARPAERSDDVRAPAPHEGGHGFTWLMLHDIQGLYGGRALYVRPDGSVVVQVVDVREPEGLEDARYEGVLSAQARARVNAVLTDVDFRDMTVPDRPGVPDEARAVLTVRFDDGVVHSASKWANDEHAAFARVYRTAMEIADAVAASSTPNRVPYDWDWRPAGVAWPSLR